MPDGAITSYIDVAQLTLYAFWLFFAGLIFYLRREDRREGYPLESDLPRRGRRGLSSLLFIPPPKTFILPQGGTSQAPTGRPDDRPIRAKRLGPWPGAPLQPTGDPMQDGVGPAAYAQRRDEPELALDGEPLLVPLRSYGGAEIATRDSDPRGMRVIGADGVAAGVVHDVWVDKSDPLIRYYEVDVGSEGTEGARRVLVPATLARVNGGRRRIMVKSILSSQFAGVPTLKNPDVVTKLEEDRITAYFAAGHLFATPSRREPLL